MGAPFPGMDPFLEEPSGWTSVHHRLISVISDTLIEQVAPHFSVSIEERVYITDDDTPAMRQSIAPDIFLVQRPAPPPPQSTAIATITPATIIERLPASLEVRDRYITIYDRRNRELVTIIEILSPWNKARGTRGNREFLSKRTAVFSTDTHWIEIDLLRAGERPEEVASQSDYYVLLRRGNAGSRLEVWYIDLRDPLPRISVPLRALHADIVLDLQAAFTLLYNRAHYAEDIDYTRPVPPPALRPADAAWVAQSITQWQNNSKHL
ncbi:DUF4058 family protein [Candidatus Oscillochloris fontis]|uniref:DUF4058 family protein n=1 Tax=Candidatus Oscillochloris fontis TaxID=2496868 RepID=UPI00101C371B|nr:DUF4058 family protein [Candidatus Oscillochloris fontis]